MSKKKPVSTPWRLLGPGATVILKGREWKIEELRADRKTGRVKVTIAGKTTTFGPKDKVDFLPKKVFEKPAADPVKLAKKAHKAKKSKPPKKPKVEPGEKWSAPPQSKGEKNVVEILGAKLDGVRPTKSEEYLVPLLDPSTIAAHLLAFHGVNPDTKRYEPLKALHDDEHARFEAGDLKLPIPHWHEARQPKAISK